MGTDYDCGCRRDMNSRWHLCEWHEVLLLAELNEVKMDGNPFGTRK